MTDSLKDQANKAALAAVTPQSFTVGGWTDGKYSEGGLTYQRKWSNGWGATAYAKAWWNDAAVIPTDRSGYVIGSELTKKF